ncbi:P-loop NTPase fold protein [Pseudomonas sp. DWP1b1]|uniref:YobI family P-loop NTPase n=1 Tax=unclassified Pseudomonas TaxID=196821 RepID=UPI003CE69E63
MARIRTAPLIAKQDDSVTQGLVCRLKRSFNAFLKTWNADKAIPKSDGAFEPLTPVLLGGSQADRYASVFLHALRNEQVRNIALTGGYGAGKSSVIRTFFDRYPEFKHVLISLATFTQESPAGRDAEADLMSRIEETIVQQLLYAVPAKKLPKTRLKRIVQASNTSIALHTVFFALLIVSVLRMYLPSVNMLPKIDPAWLVPALMRIPDWIALIFAGASGLYILHSVLKYLSLFSIDGLTLKGGKLEATHHGSVLHKNVDEIIYCFERSDIDVVVIEDLDRFGIQDVFFRLREINFTIRQSPQIKRPVHFIYAIRDELFSVGEKTKFFDLVIPVIPVVSSENSGEKMLDLLRAERFKSVFGSLDRGLIETVCDYIDEMRLIKNIVNEFDIFSSLLGDRGVVLDANKLFAMVVVRNLYPEAFADLIKRRGAIYSVITGFSGWRDEKARIARAAILHLQDRETEMEPDLFEQRIESLRTESVHVLRMAFRDAVNSGYEDVLARDLKGLEGVIELMRAGFFDIDYNDYLSFFYEGALTQDDKNLILALRRGESPKVMTFVNDPARVLGKLEHDSLAEGRGLISGLVEYLCSQSSVSDEALHAGKLATILNAAPQYMDRFAEMADSLLLSAHVPALIQAIYETTPMLLEQLVISMPSGPRQALLCTIFSSLSPDQIAALDEGGMGILHSVEELPDVTDLVPLLAQGEGAWKWLHEQPVQFHNLSDTTRADDLKQLVSLGFIEPRLDMLRLICSTFETASGNDERITYRRLLALELDGMEKLLDHAPHTLIKELLSQSDVLDESVESLTKLLAAGADKLDQVASLLEHTKSQLIALESTPEAVWSLLLNAERISDKSQAVWTYFRAVPLFSPRQSIFAPPKGGYSKKPERAVLGTFIERNAEALADTLWTLHPERHHELQRYLLQDTVLSNDTLKLLLSRTTLKSIGILSNVPEARWGMLVASTFLPYTEEVSSIVQKNASQPEAERFEQRKLEFDATNRAPTPHMTTTGVTDT